MRVYSLTLMSSPDFIGFGSAVCEGLWLVKEVGVNLPALPATAQGLSQAGRRNGSYLRTLAVTQMA
jgi:hypothetical protein